MAPWAYGRDFVVRRTVEGYTLNIVLDRNPPVIGPNKVRIGIVDRGGKAVTNVPVTVNYYMPPMPGMPPMNYTVKAVVKGSEYTMTMDLIMTGPWNVVIKAAVPEKALRVTVPIDVR